ncbi:hypothetical protein DOJK_01760 [Patescibacteria group bacterium]|jgi:hypothetical protein|nr:hypothetical protein [Candidatus Dojkabacteria bacterium]CAG1022574.1 hypothetical protein DOJK_01760 [Patescibacteria group bacterium]
MIIKKIYLIVQNILVFFFVWAIFRKTLIIGGSLFVDEFMVALLYGLLIAFTPNLLKFFKLPVNFGSLFLITLIISFLYFFVEISVLNIINLTGQNLNLGLDFVGTIVLEDKTYALVLLSVITSLLSVSMELLKKK